MNCIYWCGVCASVVFGWVWWKLSNVKFYSDIPILPGYPVLGTVLLLVPIFGFTAHREILHLLDHYGAICQCLLLGKHCMIINDPRVIKIAMEKVKGKGDIHVRSFHIIYIYLKFIKLFNSNVFLLRLTFSALTPTWSGNNDVKRFAMRSRRLICVTSLIIWIVLQQDFACF